MTGNNMNKWKRNFKISIAILDEHEQTITYKMKIAYFENHSSKLIKKE
jgi:hypothetical protein